MPGEADPVMPGLLVRPKPGLRTGSGPASRPSLAARRQGVDAGAKPRHLGAGRYVSRLFARHCTRLPLVCLSLVLAALVPAHADPSGTAISMRAGDHPGFGRLVFDFARRVPFQVAREGDRLVLRFPTDTAITPPPHMPHNVGMVETAPREARVTLGAAAEPRVYWLGSLLVVDVFDPDGAAARASPSSAKAPEVKPGRVPGGVASRPAAAHAAAFLPIRRAPDTMPRPVVAAAGEQASVPPAASASPAGTPPTPAAPDAGASAAQPAPAVPATPTGPSAGPVALVATRMQSLPRAGAVLSIPFSEGTSAAAFRRGKTAIVVFDERRPIDLAALRNDPVFGAATVQLLPNATLLRFPLPPERELALAQSPQSWRIGIVEALPPGQPIVPQVSKGQALLPIDGAGGVVTIADPETDASLLVATQHVTGQAVPALRRTPEFDLLPTWQGVVVEPLSDAVMVRPDPGGLTLTGGADGLAVSPSTPALQALADAAGMTRRFDLRTLAPEAMLQRLSQQVEAAASAPPLGRGRPRRDAATTMIALGWGAEAQAMLQLAATDDPAGATAPDVVGLTAIAALLAHRPAEADGITDPRLTGSDDVTLWRAVRDAMLVPDSPQAAVGFAATVPLIDVYPPALRQRLLPLAFETMIDGGQAAAAGRLLASRPDDPSLALARAMFRASNGDIDGALADFDALAADPDRRVHAIAAVRAVELRLTAGRIDAGQAADALDRLLYAWRGGRRELALRERVAALRERAGAWRPALAMLRETEGFFPDDKDAVHVRMKDAFAALLHDNALDHMPPFDLVALLEENADLLPGGAAGEALDDRLADRLVALDLPQKAAPLLEKLMQAAPTPAARSSFAIRLATVRLREDDPKGALAALTASDNPSLPSAMSEPRALLVATARARLGDPAGAAAGLAALDTAATDAARATILEQARDWPGAEQALRAYVAKVVPAADILAPAPLSEEQQRALVRYATAAAQVGDDATLAELRTHYESRMPRGAFGDMFRLLTAAPVQGVVDLPRSGRESLLAHELPQSLGALAVPRLTQ